MARHVSYWLVPAAEPKEFFQGLIDALGKTHQAPSFVPHVTIYSGESAAADDPQAIIAQSTWDVQEVRLDIERVSQTDLFTKSLFVQFHQSEPLTRIADRMRHLSASPSMYELNPHLSLIYKHMESRDKRAIASRLQLSTSVVLFDAVWAIGSEGTPRVEEDVRSWQVLCRKSLGSPKGRTT